MSSEFGFEGKADVFVPDGLGWEAAMARVTHLGVGAHQDDLEFMAYDGILRCYRNAQSWFGGVTCTDGAGSSRTGPYAHYTDAALCEARVLEQRQAAVVGEYGVMLQLGYPSRAVKEPGAAGLVADLRRILAWNRLECVYTHNPADKHDTHIGVVVALLDAVKGLPREARPRKIYGCEVWRDLDWLADAEKVVMDLSGRPNLAAALNGCFDSQISGGKRYDLGVLGRRSANATFFQSHASDAATQLAFAMDLTPFVEEDAPDLLEYVGGALDRFKEDVLGRLRRRIGR
jgi:LmbE family N-acetylglucosaminyl deacetylase